MPVKPDDFGDQLHQQLKAFGQTLEYEAGEALRPSANSEPALTRSPRSTGRETDGRRRRAPVRWLGGAAAVAMLATLL